MKQLLLMIGMGVLFSTSARAATNPLDGKAIFDKNCSVCHSINPPPKLAPPIVPLASRYHLQFQSKAEGVNHLAAYLKAPNKKNSIDPQAIIRFGLMPPVALSDKELHTVAEWVWEQDNQSMGRGRGRRFGVQGQ